MLYSTTAVLVCSALTLAASPRPDLYPDIDFSRGVEDRNGRLLRLALASDERYRLRYALEQIAPQAVSATLLYEDRHFFAHPGVNPVSLIRAAWSTYVVKRRVVGASTITMQLARIRFGLNTTSITGKCLQVARALQLEWHYAKRDILAAYLNLAPYGGNVEGIGTAALVYFGKPPSLLSLPEAMALAVVPQNPVKRNPASESGYRSMIVARQRLLQAWTEQQPLTRDRIAQFDLPLAVRAASQLPYIAPHFSREVLAQHSDSQRRRFGLLRTTLDTGLQQRIEQQVKRYIQRRQSVGIANASVLLLEHQSMEILAAMGSADFYSEKIQGRVDGTRAKRSPGSTLKPFVYGLAMDQGLVHPMSLLRDAPKRFAAYTPENFDRGFMGPIVATDALINSRNVPAIELLSRVSTSAFHELLLAGGVSNLRSPEHYGLAAVLGGNELTMRELSELYAALANGGIARSAKTLLSTPESNAAGQRLLSAEASYLLLDMLQQNPRPDQLLLAAAKPSVPIAWKTGTSYAYRDAWTVGVIGPYVLAVWVGNFDGRSNPAFVGRTAAAPLFFELADALTAGLPGDHGLKQRHTAGLNLQKVDVCASTGDLPGRHCPRTRRSWFIPGVSPIKVSTVHRAIRVDNRTGARSCSFDPSTSHQSVYEFWPSDFSALFRQAGISIRRPPVWDHGCAMDLQAASGAVPVITSPAPSLSYYLRPDEAGHKSLPLTAIADADVKWLYWFVDNQFVGKAEPSEALLWAPKVGSYDVLAIDDLGRRQSRALTVAMTR